jgi:ATP-dependent helicase HrpB
LRQHMEQLIWMARPPKQTRHDDEALLLSVSAGFPDRVARRRTGNQVLLSTGISAEVAGETSPYEFMLALDAEERQENPLPLIRMFARVEPEWLLDPFPDRIQERSSVVWNRITERVEKVSALLYDNLIIEESRGIAPEAEAAELLAQKAFEIGVDRFVEGSGIFPRSMTFARLESPDLLQNSAQSVSGTSKLWGSEKCLQELHPPAGREAQHETPR